MNSIMSFNGRSRAFETKFVLDQELSFKIASKTHALVAEWAANRIGLDSDKTVLFVQSFKDLGLKSGSTDEFKQKILANFASNKIEISENALERLISLKAQLARKQILNENTSV